MTRKFFGTDGIRGLTNSEPMTAQMALAIGMAAGAADQLGPGELWPFFQPLFDRALGLVAQFVTVWPEQLNAIVGERVV